MGSDFGPHDDRNGRFDRRYKLGRRRVIGHDLDPMLNFNFPRKTGWLFVGLYFVITPLVMTAIGQDDRAAYDQGVASFRSGNYSRAESLFETVIKDDSENGQAHFMLARIYTETELEDYGKAGDALGALPD